MSFLEKAEKKTEEEARKAANAAKKTGERGVEETKKVAKKTKDRVD